MMFSSFGGEFIVNRVEKIQPMIELRDLQDETFKGCDLFSALLKADCHHNYVMLANMFDYSPVEYERCYEYMTETFFTQFGCVDPDGQWDLDLDIYFQLMEEIYGFSESDFEYIDFQYIYKEVEWETLNDVFYGFEDAMNNENSIYRKQPDRVYTTTRKGKVPEFKEEPMKD